MATLQVRITEKEAEMVKAYAKRKGLSISQLVREEVVKKAQISTRAAFRGIFKGAYMADDFCEPIDDMKEYMP
ncbi:MAG: DUF2281 domain-containing protein [Clostridiales Family XIII bacterium]|jgi:hypothetical protein|nr:DUF2281 domain-containing protein [Clostridiales Family XIII bacterium]